MGEAKWVFVSLFNVNVKLVLPPSGTGTLPDWLRNLVHGQGVVALDTFNYNLCLWRCIGVH